MKKRTLGNTGFQVTEISFGAWAIGSRAYGQVTEQDARECLQAYIEGGGNLIDTARQYDESEAVIGRFVRDTGMRKDVFIASKTKANDEVGIRRDTVESLSLLKTDYIDLHYLHAPPDGPAEMERALEVFERLKEEGKIRAIGASIKGPDVSQRTLDLCKQYIHTGKIDAIQCIFSILRQKNRSIFKAALEGGVGIVARTPLESGFLTAKYPPGTEFAEKDHRRRYGKAVLSHILECVEELNDTVVTPPFETLSQVSIRFALDQENVTTVLLGAKTRQQMLANLKVLELPRLPKQLLDQLVRAYGERTEQFNIEP